MVSGFHADFNACCVSTSLNRLSKLLEESCWISGRLAANPTFLKLIDIIGVLCCSPDKLHASYTKSHVCCAAPDQGPRPECCALAQQAQGCTSSLRATSRCRCVSSPPRL